MSLDPKENRELDTAIKKVEEFKAEIPFDSSKPVAPQIEELNKKAMGDKYAEAFSGDKHKIMESLYGANKSAILAFEQTFEKNKDKIVKMELKEGTLYCYDNDGKVLVEMNIAEMMRKTIEQTRDKEKDDFVRRYKERRFYEFRRSNPDLAYNDSIIRRMEEAEEWATKHPEEAAAAAAELSRETSGSARGNAGRISLPSRRPETESRRKVTERMQKLFESRKTTRADILQSLNETKDADDYEIIAQIDPNIAHDNAEEFEEHWRQMDYRHEIDELFREDANPDEGYTVNPFKKYKWSHETLRNVMQYVSTGDMYLRDVTEVIYSQKFEDFTAELKKAGTPDAVIGLLDDDDIFENYKKLKGILENPDSDDNKSLQKYKTQIESVVQILSDYIAYAVRLTNLVNRLRYNPAGETTRRERGMLEFKKDALDRVADTSENRVKEALHEIFIYDVESPTAYTSELRHLFSWVSPERKVTFEDLRGNTASVQGEWFTENLSPEAAYKAAFESIVTQKRNDDGTWSEVIDETDAAIHINRLLKLGITAYPSTPANLSLKDIIDSLASAGVEESPGRPINFTGNTRTDLQNLINALEIKDLSDLKKNGTDAEKAITAERLKFIRIGSVLWQKNLESAQEEHQQENTTAKVELTEEQAGDIVENLRRMGKFSEERLTEIKTNLIGGIGAMVPMKGGKMAAGAFLRYDLGDGFSVDIAGGDIEGPPAFLGLGAGKKFEVREDLDITIHAGAGVVVAQGSAPGWTVGVDGTLTKKYEAVDLSFHAGIGMGIKEGNFMPGASIGQGFSWAKSQEKYEKTLTELEAKAHIDELEKSGDVYAAVKERPLDYPELQQILYRIEMVEGLDPASQKQMFLNVYEMYRDGIRANAIDLSKPGILMPTGAGIGLAVIPLTVPPIVAPYAYIEFNLWSRNLVYRIAGSVQNAQNAAEDQADAAIAKSFAERKGGAGSAKVETKTLAVSGELIWDSKREKLLLSSGEKSVAMDWSRPTQFGQFREELSANANIFVEGKENGLLLLKPEEAYGNIELYVDPQLADKVTVVTRGGQLYLSVAEGTQMFIKRKDVSYPFEEAGAVEVTTICISANQDDTTETIKGLSPVFMERLLGREWTSRPRSEAEGGTAAEKAKNAETYAKLYKSWDAYKEWWGTGREGMIAYKDMSEYKPAWETLNSAVRAGLTETASGGEHLRPEIMTKVEELTKDAAFIQGYRTLSTRGFDVMQGKKKITGSWHENFPEVARLIQTRVGQEMNPTELDSAMLEIMVSSFQDLQKRAPDAAKAEYSRLLNAYHRPLFESIFDKYYEDTIPDATARQAKVKATVDFLIGEFEKLDVTSAGAKLEAGTHFATLVGMGRVTGIRWFYNFRDTAEKYGLIGEHKLDAKAAGTEGELAKFWIETLSPFKLRIQDKESYTEKDYADIYEKMHSPLALKLAPMVAYSLEPDEMKDLAAVYNSLTADRANAIRNNLVAVRKFMNICDKVRTAELDGKPLEIKINDEFTLVILEAQASQGIFKRCGNPSGILHEKFALKQTRKGADKLMVFAGKGESNIGVKTSYDRADIRLAVGIAMPIPVDIRLNPQGRPETSPLPQGPERQPPTENPTVIDVRPYEPMPPAEPAITAEGVTPAESQAGGVGGSLGNNSAPEGTGVSGPGSDAG